LRSLNDQALQQYFASAQARKATDILLVSQVANQYLTMLADDEVLAVTQHTLKRRRRRTTSRGSSSTPALAPS
jgi:multidrug efflux system outer membrane protein